MLRELRHDGDVRHSGLLYKPQIIHQQYYWIGRRKPKRHWILSLVHDGPYVCAAFNGQHHEVDDCIYEIRVMCTY